MQLGVNMIPLTLQCMKWHMPAGNITTTFSQLFQLNIICSAGFGGAKLRKLWNSLKLIERNIRDCTFWSTIISCFSHWSEMPFLDRG